jgi:MFS family permease
MLKLTLLSIALLTVFGSAAIAPALSEIALSFPHIPATQIKALLTAPSLSMVCIAPFIGKIIQKTGKKNLLLVGLLCYLLGGMGGAITSDFYTLFCTRILLGVGIGILMPMANGLIAEYYSGKERLQLMGWASSATNFFGIASNLLVGYLAIYNWRYGLAIYAMALPVLLLVIAHIPSRRATAVAKNTSTKLPFHVYGWGLAMFLIMMGIYAVPVNIALFITENKLGGPREAGLVMACLSVSGIIAGLLGVRARALLGRYFVFAMLTLITAGYVLLTSLISLPTAIISLLAIGLGSGFIMPYLIYSATSSVPDSSAVGTMGIIATAASLGQFATPVILDGIAYQLGDSSTHFVFQLVGIATGIAALVCLVRNRFTNTVLNPKATRATARHKKTGKQ